MSKKADAETKLLLLCTLLAVVAPLAKAEFMGFSCIANNAPLNCNAVVGTQFMVEVTDAGSNQALVTFMNSGPAASSMTDIFFEDDTLLNVAFVFGSLAPPFQTAAGFSVRAAQPDEHFRVNPDE